MNLLRNFKSKLSCFETFLDTNERAFYIYFVKSGVRKKDYFRILLVLKYQLIFGKSESFDKSL